MKHTYKQSHSFMVRMLGKLCMLSLALWAFSAIPTWADETESYTLQLKANPAKAGSFNTSNASLTAGKVIHLYAYANSNFDFKEWTDENGNIVSDKQDFEYIMPTRDVTLTAVFKYNPVNPGNPHKNYWNAATGEVIVDDFKAGSLSTEIKNAMGSNTSYSQVLSVTVAGVMNNSDFNVTNNCSRCTSLDLSRTSGFSAIPSYAFDYTPLQMVSLPSSVERIGSHAFYQCSQMNSMTIYALTPPVLEYYALQGVNKDMIVFVPASAVAQYQEADGWKNFTILPIQDELRSLRVSLPKTAKPSDYKNMYLELTNTKSGQRQHFVMTDREEYSFSNIIKNTEWNVTLKSERGDIYGEIRNVAVKDTDVAVVFASLNKPQEVTVKVVTPEGKDVTDQTFITWLDHNGNYISQAASLNCLPVGMQLNCQISLQQQALALKYVVPTRISYVVKDSVNLLTCQLSPLSQVTLVGRVIESKTHAPMSQAIVTASQTFSGKFNHMLTTQTDEQGNYKLTVPQASTNLTIASSDYISQSISCDTLKAQGDTLKVDDMMLKAIEGATVDVELRYRTCADTIEDGYSQSGYEDYNDVSYTIYNKTRRCNINNISVQYPKIVLLDNAEVNDELSVTISSKSHSFASSSVDTKIDNFLQATASFEIVEKGQIRSSFAKNNNEKVVGILYAKNGMLINTYDYDNAVLTIKDLANGIYSLVTMKKSDLFNSLSHINQLQEVGLIPNVDYVVNSAKVNSGEVSAIVIDEVPSLDESKLYYTGDNTSISINKPSIVVGNYLTMSIHLDFKSIYVKDVKDVSVVVDLPESCSFVEGSLMVGNVTSTYTHNGSRLQIPLSNYGERIRFCFIPTQGGEFTPSAMAQFSINGKRIAQPLGCAKYTAKNLSIAVPSTTSKNTIAVSGTAQSMSDIEVFDDNMLIGQTKASANGTWIANCILHEAYNLSEHNIHAKATNKQGLELESETANCLYDMNAIEPSKITMLNTAHTAANLNLYEYKTVFDYQNPKESFSPYWYWPKYPDFTFLIDFTRNDTTIITDVQLHVLLSDKTVRTLKPSFDTKKNCWVVMDKFYSNALPTTVSVTYNANVVSLVDSRELKESERTYYEGYDKSIKERQQSISEWQQESEIPNRALWDKLSLLLNDESQDNEEEIDHTLSLLIPDAKADSTLNVDELIARVNADLNANNTEKANLDAAYQEVLNAYLANPNAKPSSDDHLDYTYPTYGGLTRVIRDKLTSINEEELLKLGYEKFDKTDGTSLYWFCNDTVKILVDSEMMFRTSVRTIAETKAPALREQGNSPMCIQELESAWHSLADLHSDLQKENSYKKIVSILTDIASVFNDIFDAFECSYEEGLKGAKVLTQKSYETAVKILQAHKSKVYKDRVEAESALKYQQEQRSLLNRQINNATDNISKLNSQLAKAETEAEKKLISKQIDIEMFRLETYKKNLVSNKANLQKTQETLKRTIKELENIEKQQNMLADALKQTRSFLNKVPSSIKAARSSKKIKWVGNVSKVVGTTVGAALQLIPFALNVLECSEQLVSWCSLLSKELAKLPCENDRARWLALWGKSIASAIATTELGKATVNCDIYAMLLDASDNPGAWLGSLFIDLSSWGIGAVRDKTFEKTIKHCRKELSELKCKGDTDNNNNGNNNNSNNGGSLGLLKDIITWPFSLISHVMDPSGYVYESVLSNRLEGVKATAYYKETVEDMYGDIHENVVKWNAEEYAQKNPLFTDENGYYQWDVPQGLWQVKFEKEGYETTYSEWLPVPPPQLDVNIGMKQNVQPQVKEAKAYDDAVEVVFDKYMDISTLTTDNVQVLSEGKAVEGTIELKNAEEDYADNSRTYASKLRFNAAQPFPSTEVTLVVKNQVKSYADIRMATDFMQDFTVSHEVKRIVCDSLIEVVYGQTGEIQLEVLPAAAAAGKEVEISLSSDLILSTTQTSCTLDENGHTTLSISGELPGMAAATFHVVGTELTATTLISVVQPMVTVEAPTSNLASGSTIDWGTSVTLNSKTEGAQIYYTLDGSCPCEDTDARHLYDGNPIILSSDTELKAMAILDGTESEVVTFVYKIDYLNEAKKIEVYEKTIPANAIGSFGQVEEVKAAIAANDVALCKLLVEAYHARTTPVIEAGYYRLINAQDKKYLTPYLSGTDVLMHAGTEEKGISNVFEFVPTTTDGQFVIKANGCRVSKCYTTALGSSGANFKLIDENSEEEGHFSFENAQANALFLIVENATTTSGHHNYLHEDNGNAIGWDKGDNNGVGHPSAWYIVPATEAEVALTTVDNASYASAYLPFNASHVEGAKAYYGMLNEEHTIMDMYATAGIAARKGVVLIGPADAEKATLTIGETDTFDSSLSGTLNELTLTSDTRTNYLIFGVNDGKVGFYRPNSALPAITANKAFLYNTFGSAAIAMRFNGSIVGISDVITINVTDAPIFDLSGRRVDNPIKGGVYIQNGHKFIK